MFENEIWKDVVGYEGLYQVSDAGRVRSLDRMAKTRWEKMRLHKGRMISIRKDRDGYHVVNLYNSSHKTVKIHRLVMDAFVGPCPDRHQVCHNNGVPDDNRIENLRYDTAASNCQDKVVHGTSLKGERNHKAKLTESDVSYVRLLSSSGLSGASIAKLFTVSTSTVNRVLRRDSWQHI